MKLYLTVLPYLSWSSTELLSYYTSNSEFGILYDSKLFSPNSHNIRMGT